MLINKLRLKKGWSQQQLAQVSGTSLRTIQRVEAGATASLETLKSLAAVFEVSLEDLQGEPDMIATENAVSPQEALAMRQVSQLRGFYVHVVAYVVVCTAALVALFVLSRDNLWAGALLWAVWGAGLAVHATRTFLLGGSWERRQVERRLGRPL